MKKYFPVLIVLAIMFLPLLSIAQPGFGDDVDDVPVDGGLSLLIASGIGYGVNKLKNKKTQRITNA